MDNALDDPQENAAIKSALDALLSFRSQEGEQSCAVIFKRGLAFVIKVCLSNGAAFPTAVFGSEFSKTISQSLLGISDEAWLNGIGVTAKAVNQFVNAAINYRSLSEAPADIQRMIKESSSVTRFIVGMLGVASLIGALPYMRFVEDALKSWGSEATTFMDIIQFAVMSVLNLRSSMGLIEGAQKVFGAENREVAVAAREEILISLNRCLSQDSQVSHHDLALLSRGELTKPAHPYAQNAAKVAVIGVVGFYSYGYVVAATEAATAFGCAAWLARSVAWISGMLKFSLLGRVGLDITDKMFDEFINHHIIDVPKSKAEKYIAIVSALISLFSITNASEVVQKYIFNQSKAKSVLSISLGTALAGAFPINYDDTRQILIDIKDALTSSCCYTPPNYETHIKNLMLHVAATSDTKALSRWTKRAGNDHMMGSLNGLAGSKRVLSDSAQKLIGALGVDVETLEQAYNNQRLENQVAAGPASSAPLLPS